MAPVKGIRKSPKPSLSKAKSSVVQGGLKSFGFKAPAKSKSAASSKVATSDDEEEEEDSDDENMGGDEPMAKKGKQKIRPDLSDLPPLTNISDIFADLVNRIPDLIKVAEKLKGKKLRVATMCSGTESPLLALMQVSRVMKRDHGVTLEFEHVFSCEIVPWKQAYIERNFSPPVLFRDVTELGNEEATTAYGAMAPVPLAVDMLIAGTSCVDYSSLNNNKQSINARGESGETFRGMMRWVARAKPTIIILENVCSAPWPKVQEYVEAAGYSAIFTRFDTKLYYVPHTRTRGYLFAVRKKHDRERPQQWLEMVKSLQRPASAPYDAWLLEADDPRIQQGREKLVKEGSSSVRQRVVEWSKCETRHARARFEEQLGPLHPLTAWTADSRCKIYDFAWIDWATYQVNRVWDLMDISWLRGVAAGYDATYKSIFWNLSQNVDRQIGSNIQGISPCMTPTMIPYLNFRGGPMLGLESLSLQGLPVDELILTRETEDNLADLAGNAMSSTVVGTTMLAALVTCLDLLRGVKSEQTEDIEMAGDGGMPGEKLITGLDQLTERPLDLSHTGETSLTSLLRDAQASARLCVCEGRTGMSSLELWRCQDCNHSVCSRCGGRPEHNFSVIDTVSSPRVPPLKFGKEAMKALPMCLKISGIAINDLDALKSTLEDSIPSAVWNPYRKAVMAAIGSEFRFHSLKRQVIWVATFDSPTAYLEFHLDPKTPQWMLFGKADPSEPMNSPTRTLLQRAVARCKVSENLLGGTWELAMPLLCTINVTIQGVQQDVAKPENAVKEQEMDGLQTDDVAIAEEASGEQGGLVYSWEHRVGLQGPKFKGKKVWSKLEISVAEDDKSMLDFDISGVYRWLYNCAAANASLHVREGTAVGEPPLYLLLDPSKWGDAASDSFVFSRTFRRFEYGETRPVVATLAPKWRQSDSRDTETISASVSCRWVPATGMVIKTAELREAFSAIPTETLKFDVTNAGCASAKAILTVRVRLDDKESPMWTPGTWSLVDKVHERKIFQSLAFLTSRLTGVASMDDWQHTAFSDHEGPCLDCAPTPPTIHWVLDPKSRSAKAAIGVEDAEQAGEFERRLKRRPQPFVTQLSRDDDGFGHVRIGINIAALTHQAAVRLPSGEFYSPIETSYRITTDHAPPAKLTRPKFVLKSNKLDVEHEQPPHFRKPLRKEQLRSLTWMVDREKRDIPEFVEEEIVEGILEPLGWRAEAKASRKIRVRGGVLADQVGYGKTAITLGLIACQDKKWSRPTTEVTKGLLAVKATLVLVPSHLVKQWETEVTKFTKNMFEVVAIYTAVNLKKFTVRDIMDADIVIMASSVFNSPTYLEWLGSFAGEGALPTTSGRHFRDRLGKTIAGIQKQAKRLREDGVEGVYEAIVEGEKIDTSLHAFAPSKRLRGQKFRDAAAARATESSNATSATEGSDGEVKDDENKPKVKRQKMLDVYIDVRAEDLLSQSRAATTGASKSRKVAPSNGKRPRQRRSSPIIIDSDSDSDTKATKKKKASDDEDFAEDPASASSASSESDEAEPSEDDSEGSDVEEEKAPSKTKPKPQPTNKKRKSSAMDLDGGEEDKGGKKKAPKKEKPPPKVKPSVSSQDPWALKTPAARKDWHAMKCPPMELFHWNRVVTDEYTYVKDHALVLIPSLLASCRWVLSGTPPIGDFASVKTIAVFLGLQLGIEDLDEAPTGRGPERTSVEKFHSYREARSISWYLARYAVGQRFLDQFVRQNIAEIDEIPFEEHIELIDLPAAERALERELDHTLKAQDMMLRRGKKKDNDRDTRISDITRDSNSAQEALLKCVAYFDNVQSGAKNAMKACDYVVQLREKELETCKRSIYDTLVILEKQKKNVHLDTETHYEAWVRTSGGSGVGDQEATAVVRELFDCARKAKPFPGKAVADPKVEESDASDNADSKGKAKKTGSKAAKAKATDGKSKTSKSKKSKDDDDDEIIADDDDEPKSKGKKKPTDDEADRVHEHRETTHLLIKDIRTAVGRIRSLRYFKAVRDIQNQHKDFKIECIKCGRTDVGRDEAYLFSACGHIGCSDCIKRCARDQECIVGRANCEAEVTTLNTVAASVMGIDDGIKDAKRHFGKKLETVVDLIKNRIKKSQKVLMFIQFEDLMKNVAQALESNDIKCLQLRGDAKKQSDALMNFQGKESKDKVLLLSLESESASGANLTVANHIIFLCPMYPSDLDAEKQQSSYIATDTQAVGRARRYGQTRKVHCWRFVARDTIDVDVYKQFTGRDFQKEGEEQAEKARARLLQKDGSADAEELDTVSAAVNELNVDTSESEGGMMDDDDVEELDTVRAAVGGLIVDTSESEGGMIDPDEDDE
ncbi:hypothetical protein FRB94_003868 [Tulasnella sp. JGI-2019a]|nr:hypothetical protein FRB93_013172 [Tulasnella sp. JGI-2019a]KAG9002457.1 hypothetical protein FRB94_003868 [Tulasnella sp. JGI-2019a]